jgi:hypothetical protein
VDEEVLAGDDYMWKEKGILVDRNFMLRPHTHKLPGSLVQRKRQWD